MQIQSRFESFLNAKGWWRSALLCCFPAFPRGKKGGRRRTSDEGRDAFEANEVFIDAEFTTYVQDLRVILIPNCL
jgi:hypothetical protein